MYAINIKKNVKTFYFLKKNERKGEKRCFVLFTFPPELNTDRSLIGMHTPIQYSNILFLFLQ